MKVLIVTNSVIPLSGWGRYSLGVVTGLKDLGHEVDVAADAQDGSRPDITLGSSKSIFSVLKNLFVIRRSSTQHKIVHALDGWPYAVYGYIAVLGTNKKLFINGVGTYSVAPLSHWLKGILLRLAYKRAEKVFCISSYVEKEIRSFVPHIDTAVVHLGVSDLTKIVSQDPSEILKKLRLSDRSPIFLTVGAVKHRKGQLTSLMALRELREAYPTFLYILVGSDNDAEYVKSIRNYAEVHNLQDNLLIRPDITSDEDLAQFYTIADVLLLNSENESGHFEGFGLVIIEAAMFGIPAVGSIDCGIEDAINNGVTGYLARQRDPADIALKIQMLLEHREEMGKNSVELSRKFSWNNTVLAYEKQYRKIWGNISDTND